MGTVPTKPQPSKKASVSCMKNINTLTNYGRVPNIIQNLTCFKRDECYQASTSTMVIDKNSGKVETVNVVVACLKRVTCTGKTRKNMIVTQTTDATKNPPKIKFIITCKKPEDEIFIMLPIFKGGEWVYEKKVYDCRCPCPGI